MLRNRQYTPTRTVTLRELAAAAGLPYPLMAGSSVRVEMVEAPLTGDDVTLWRNFPDRSYSTCLVAPREIVEALAYEAFEWEAREIMKQANKASGAHKFPLLT